MLATAPRARVLHPKRQLYLHHGTASVGQRATSSTWGGGHHMKTTHRGTLPDGSADSGLTLIEVLAAVIVITIVALSSAGLSINGINTAAAQERQQVGVTIANGEMENVSGKAVVNLTAGRCQNDVAAAFSANSSKPGVSATYPAWDTAAACGCPVGISVPIVQLAPPTGVGPCAFSAQNGTKYTMTTLIGTCYEPATGGACSVITGQTVAPATPPAGYAALVRVIVLVSWTAGSQCSVTACYYETSTLADPNSALTWVPGP
jgi:prepilin-type N-terminal cleavage/methylation domain-containing protein